MTPPTATRRPPAGLARAVLATALALAALGAVPAGPAGALNGVCRPSSPNCGPETVARGGWPDGTAGNTNRRHCPPGQPSCDPET
jgi:hypothetical protein